MSSADGKVSSSASELSASKKIEAGEIRRSDSKHSIDDDIKNIYEKGIEMISCVIIYLINCCFCLFLIATAPF